MSAYAKEVKSPRKKRARSVSGYAQTARKWLREAGFFAVVSGYAKRGLILILASGKTDSHAVRDSRSLSLKTKGLNLKLLATSTPKK